MAFIEDRARQYPLVICSEILYSDGFNVASYIPVWGSMPANAKITAGEIVVETVWNSTTNTLDIGDAADDDRYTATIIDLKTAARTALTITGLRVTEKTDLLLTYTQTGTAPTQGKAVLTAEYVVVGRGTEVQP